MATQNRHLTPKKTTLDEAIATDIAINIIAIKYLKFFLKKLSKNVATCLTLTESMVCFCLSSIGRKGYFGQMDTLLVVLENYRQRLYKNT